ncbi:MAG: hypothetical protein WD382_00885 [Halofilum sp. (in: g-proteobacteria)]
MTADAATPRNRRNVLMYYWRGEGPLWQVFWLWGVLGSWILFALFALAMRQLGLSWPLFLASAAIMIPYTGWILTSVWQCAHNLKGHYFWSNAARFLTGIWSLNVGVVGGFLLIKLISG